MNKKTEKYYQESIETAEETFNTSIQEGLTNQEAEDRLEEYGPNELEQDDEVSVWELLWENINNLVVYLLVAASVLSFIMGEPIEGFAIIIAILLAVLTGFFSELSAQQSVDSLQSMIYTTAKVLRDGEIQEIEAAKIIPGDVLILEEGDSIAADARLVEANNLAVIEAALTGESDAVDKDENEVYEEDIAMGDRLNVVYSGTAVTRGKGKAIVTATAMETEVGKITGLMNEDSDRTSPLDKELDKISRFVILLAAIAAVTVTIVGLFQNQDLPALIHIAIILAVASIPEALPAVSTITLSRGMQTMAKHQALVKSLSAVETLGSTSTIASDKTGTLTENQMMVQHVILSDEKSVFVEGEGYVPEGKFYIDDKEVDITEDNYPNLVQIIRHGLMGSNAELKLDEETDEEAKEYIIEGDPTDGALVVLAHKLDIDREKISEYGWNKIDEIPFDSDNKYKVIQFENDNEKTIIMTGAPDTILDLSDSNQAEETYWEEQVDFLTQKGMRVIALASESIDPHESRSLEGIVDDDSDEFTIEGLFGIFDPPREDVKESIETTQNAGISIKMITGDHPATASVIAEDIGIKYAENILSGTELDELYGQEGSEKFDEEVKNTAVFARVSPENKLQIVESLQKNDEIVAMTGDGVNDAPALNGADIGVAMGIRGTEVAKEASKMILTDDQFSTIVYAVREGRIIFSNIKKYISFLFACNIIEILTILLTIIFLLPMPLQALHILYLNLVIDIFPAISLSFEPAEDDVMDEEPRDQEQGLVQPKFLGRILGNGLVIAIASFLFFVWQINQGVELEYAQTAVFAFMAMGQLYHLLNVRKSDGFGLDRTLWNNKLLIGSVFLSVVLLIAAIYVPFMNTAVGTVPLSLQSWLIIIIAGLIPTAINGVINYFITRYVWEE